MNRQLPIASSSEAKEMLDGEACEKAKSLVTHLDVGLVVVLRLGHSVGKQGLEIHHKPTHYDHSSIHVQYLCCSFIRTAASIDRVKWHTFNMCNRVVFPALSRPRNRSFACLLSRPKEARTSQTVKAHHQISLYQESKIWLKCAGMVKL